MCIRGNLGGLWNEWGDMAAYGWPGSPPPGATWAGWWLSNTVFTNSLGQRFYAVILAGKHRKEEEFSSNGTAADIALDNPNAFLRCCVISSRPKTRAALTTEKGARLVTERGTQLVTEREKS